MQMQMQKRCRWSVDCPGLLLTEPEDERQHFSCPFSRQSQDIKQVMPCMQIVFSNSKSGGWISMDPSRSWPCQSVSFPFGIAASPWGGVPFSGAYTRYCGSTDRGGWEGQQEGPAESNPGLPGQHNCRGSPWAAWEWQKWDPTAAATSGVHRTCPAAAGEAQADRQRPHPASLVVLVCMVMGRVSVRFLSSCANYLIPSSPPLLCRLDLSPLQAGISCPRTAFFSFS